MSNGWVAIGLISVATFGYTGYNTNALAFPADVLPKNRVGSIWGLASMGAGFGGVLFSWLSGRMIDLSGYTLVFIGYGLVALVALALVLFALGPLSPLPEFQPATRKEEWPLRVGRQRSAPSIAAGLCGPDDSVSPMNPAIRIREDPEDPRLID